jgi:hypothetical protein
MAYARRREARVWQARVPIEDAMSPTRACGRRAYAMRPYDPRRLGMRRTVISQQKETQP